MPNFHYGHLFGTFEPVYKMRRTFASTVNLRVVSKPMTVPRRPTRRPMTTVRTPPTSLSTMEMSAARTTLGDY